MRYTLHDWHRSHVTTILLCAVLSLVIPLLVTAVWPSWSEPLELRTVDLRFRLRPPLPLPAHPSQQKSPGLVAIDYDDRAAHEYQLGRWPWNRRVHAQLLEFLKAAGAQTVVMDLLFDHPGPRPQDDQALIEATRRAGMVFYPVVLAPAHESEHRRSIVSLPALGNLLQADVQGFGEIPAADRMILPIPGLVETAKGLGHVQATHDQDGVLRRLPLLYAVDGGVLPALPFAAALQQLQVEPKSIRIEPGRAIRFTSRVVGREVTIPIDHEGRTWINYAGPWGSRFLHYPYSWLLDRLQSPTGKTKLLAGFANTTVVIANLTTGHVKQTATPFEDDFPTGELALHVLHMILTQQFLRDATVFEGIVCLAVPVLLLSLVAAWGGLRWVVPAFVILLGAYLVVLQHAFNQAQVILPVAGPLWGLTQCLGLLLAARFVMVQRERSNFETVLGAFLPPRTLRIVQESPQMISRLLAGHTRELTVFFVDIVGFSAFCKRADPLQIQQALRDYLTAMTVILRGYGGTLDKYMGDGIMAFFGNAEPEAQGEGAEEAHVELHAANAVRAGLAMQKKMTDLNLRWLSQGQEPHRIRIGINTGMVTVGNLGTEYLWDYTVVGPEVNKAHRLEKAAPPGGLLLARRTYALSRRQGVLPEDLPETTAMLKGLGKERGLYALPPELVLKLTVAPPPADEKLLTFPWKITRKPRPSFPL